MTLLITSDRRRLLADVKAGRIRHTASGRDVRDLRRIGLPERVDDRLRHLRQAGLVILGADGVTYEITADGETALEQALAKLGQGGGR